MILWGIMWPSPFLFWIWSDLKRQNEQRCEQEIEEIKQGRKSGNTFSDEALDEQKHSIRIADEKVALAVHAYDLVYNSF